MVSLVNHLHTYLYFTFIIDEFSYDYCIQYVHVFYLFIKRTIQNYKVSRVKQSSFVIQCTVYELMNSDECKVGISSTSM